VTKAAIGKSLGSHALYGVETVYLAAYAVGQYGSGWLGDRVGARRLVGVGMLIAAGASFAFGLWSVGALFLATALVNGLAQSTGWPGNVKAMQEWTTPATRGRVMGVWATCYQVGGIAATAFAAAMLARGGWRAAYFGPAVVIGAVGVLALVVIRDRSLRESAAPSQAAPETDLDRAARRAVAMSATVWWYGASYFFIKLIRYSLLFWLPFYLETVLHYGSAEAGYQSTSLSRAPRSARRRSSGSPRPSSSTRASATRATRSISPLWRSSAPSSTDPTRSSQEPPRRTSEARGPRPSLSG
jgi:sugar phosphate permease